MSALAILGTIYATAVLLMALGWVWQQRRRNAGIVDVLWSTGLALAALIAALLGSGAPAARVFVAACGGAWGLRLASHLWGRVRGEPEDGRYRALRERWGDGGARWFGMFQFQAALVALFAVPFVIVAGHPAPSYAALALGAVIWAASVALESLADRQLARFRADPANRGRACRAGLWRYSRHPNYFFEWLHWFSYAVAATGAPHGWAAWSGPVVMYLFLRYLSGIPFTEAQALRTRGEDYRAYQATTPMLFPWPPRSRAIPDPAKDTTP
ncbi:MAG: DUF1295 domain-containing protein [Proteobacteria bacterium]|nr:DUF1295 domain-containing protein [Pseudomonadota bacterium]